MGIPKKIIIGTVVFIAVWFMQGTFTNAKPLVVMDKMYEKYEEEYGEEYVNECRNMSSAAISNYSGYMLPGGSITPNSEIRPMKTSSRYVSDLIAEYKNDYNRVDMAFNLNSDNVILMFCNIYKENEEGLYYPISNIIPEGNIKSGGWEGTFYNINSTGNYAVSVFSLSLFPIELDYTDYFFFVNVDNDKNKSDFPSHTFMCTETLDSEGYMDMKACYQKPEDIAMQKLLVDQYAKELKLHDFKELSAIYVYPRRDLTSSEQNSIQTLKWKNPERIKSKVYAIAYNTNKGAYVLEGQLNDKGELIFPGYILCEATTLTFISE